MVMSRFFRLDRNVSFIALSEMHLQDLLRLRGSSKRMRDLVDRYISTSHKFLDQVEAFLIEPVFHNEKWMYRIKAMNEEQVSGLITMLSKNNAFYNTDWSEFKDIENNGNIDDFSPVMYALFAISTEDHASIDIELLHLTMEALTIDQVLDDNHELYDDLNAELNTQTTNDHFITELLSIVCEHILNENHNDLFQGF